MRLTRYATLLFCSFFTFSALAQAPADSSRALREVTVYASRLSQPSNQTGHAVTVIPGASIARYPVNSLDDLLRCLPALEIQSRGSFGAQADVSLRGSTFNQVLFLLDGLRLNDPLTGHFGAYLPITPAEIEQIEIVRGAGAALYGPDAVGGVINIVTKTFAATERRREAEFTSTTLRGEWNLWHTNTGGFLAQDRLRLGGGILLNTTAGQLRDSPSTTRSDANLKTYSLSAAYELTPRLNLAARASLDRRDYSAQYFYTTSPADRARETTNKDWYQGQLRYQHNERSRTEAQVSTSRGTDYYVFTPTSVASDHVTHYTNVLVSHQQQFSARVRATLGGQADRRAVVSNDRGNHAQWHYAGFGVVAVTPAPGLALTGGLRLDHDQAYGTELVPQLNVSQQVGEVLTVRGAIGRAIRAPDFTERYNANGRPGVVPSGFNVGNAGLQAERTLNYEIGADYHPLPGLTAKATGFLRKGNNQIDYVPTPGAQVIEASGLTQPQPGGYLPLRPKPVRRDHPGAGNGAGLHPRLHPQNPLRRQRGLHLRARYQRRKHRFAVPGQYCPPRGVGHGRPHFPPRQRQPQRPLEAARRQRRGPHQPHPAPGVRGVQRPAGSGVAAAAALAHGPGAELI
jgi:iron complex outermembrane receptor protein